jgi:hypothetical protein
VKTYPNLRRVRWQHLAIAAILAVGLAVIVSAGTTEPIDSYAACTQAGFPVLQTEPPICRDGNRSFNGTPDPVASAGPAQTTIPFEILVDGDTRTKLPAQLQTLVSTQAAWLSFWSHVHAGLPTLPPLLPVDFATSSVVAISLGPQTTTGFGLKITNISESPTGTVVSYTKTTPTITCQVTPAVSNPYLIVRTPTVTRPISFHLTTELHHCQ